MSWNVIACVAVVAFVIAALYTLSECAARATYVDYRRDSADDHKR